MMWGELTSPQIGRLDRDLPVILNLAAIEQHGPHLPVNTDAAIGAHFLGALDERRPESQIILPQISVCCSSHHLDYPGTLSVSHTTLLAYVSDILDSVRAAGFRKILLLNSHGGNQAIGQVIVESWGAAHRDCFIGLATWWRVAGDALREISEAGPFGTGHACELETSVMQAAGRPVGDIPQGEFYNHLFEWTDAGMLGGATASAYRSMREISGGTGTVGQPDLANVEKGHLITDAVIAALSAIIDDMHQHKMQEV